MDLRLGTEPSEAIGDLKVEAEFHPADMCLGLRVKVISIGKGKKLIGEALRDKLETWVRQYGHGISCLRLCTNFGGSHHSTSLIMLEFELPDGRKLTKSFMHCNPATESTCNATEFLEIQEESGGRGEYKSRVDGLFVVYENTVRVLVCEEKVLLMTILS